MESYKETLARAVIADTYMGCNIYRELGGYRVLSKSCASIEDAKKYINEVVEQWNRSISNDRNKRT